ncbi:hypothetical protein AAFF_G00158270 [Aldrovandia affinis]|uniref:Uncharacterized protein n=1 Tax=Aldrovandia affinis TaxID=143900 RepID=A0AAD7RN33_9TELE|nr:hypothetical protein AAFF_G00158270 [Aldrovandia affinis]
MLIFIRIKVRPKLQPTSGLAGAHSRQNHKVAEAEECSIPFPPTPGIQRHGARANKGPSLCYKVTRHKEVSEARQMPEASKAKTGLHHCRSPMAPG